MGMPKYWSKSSLGLYAYCPAKFKIVRLDEIKESPNIFFQRGKDFHSVAEKYYEDLNMPGLSNITTLTSENKKKIYSHIRNIIMKRGKNTESFPDIEEKLEIFAKLETKRFFLCLKHEKDIYKYFLPIEPEMEIINEKRGWIGYIDHPIRLFDDSIAVIDFKSGVFKEEDIPRLRFELYMYVILAEESDKFPGSPEYIGIVSPTVENYEAGNSVFIEKVTPERKQRCEEIVLEIVSEIEAGKFYCRPNQYCRNCDFPLLCGKKKSSDEIPLERWMIY